MKHIKKGLIVFILITSSSLLLNSCDTGNSNVNSAGSTIGNSVADNFADSLKDLSF